MTWKIVVQPTKIGIKVRTQCRVTDREAVKVAECVERALYRMSRKGN